MVKYHKKERRKMEDKKLGELLSKFLDLLDKDIDRMLEKAKKIGQEIDDLIKRKEEEETKKTEEHKAMLARLRSSETKKDLEKMIDTIGELKKKEEKEDRDIKFSRSDLQKFKKMVKLKYQI